MILPSVTVSPTNLVNPVNLGTQNINTSILLDPTVLSIPYAKLQN